MKAAPIALLALASLALAEEPTVTLNDMLFTTAVPTDIRNDGGAYSGIVMTISRENDRLSTQQDWILNNTFQLTSVELAARNTTSTDLNGTILILADAGNKFLAASQVASVTSISHKDDWGWDYTRPFATYTSFLDADEEAVTLSLGTEYHLFVSTGAKLESFLGSGAEALSSAYVNTPNLFACGKNGFPAATASNLGFLSGTLGVTSTGYAPLVGITVSNAPVPEPATGTLSLMALAGLAVRRFRK